jgi:hypothetical protein
MNKTQGYMGIVVLVVVLILGIGIYMIQNSYREPVTPVVVDQTPVQVPQPNENDRIIAAVDLFATSAPAIFTNEFVCKGGFINEEVDELKRISDTIVRNRIFDIETMQYAVNQDEAGISCLESGDKWVLFTALNQTSAHGESNYYCADSQGVRGAYGLDTEDTQCVTDSSRDE